MNVYTVNGVQLAPGLDFTTTQQRIDTAEESAHNHGAPIGSYVAAEIQHPYAGLDDLSDVQLSRWQIVRSVVADPVPLPPPEVPMYRVKIVLAQQGLTAGVTSYIASLSEPQKTIAQTLWDGAPNLVVQGDFALQVKAAMGLTDEQYQALIDAALALTL